MDEIAAIEGNAFALEHAPDHLVITDIPTDLAIERLTTRTGKADDSIFEKKDFFDTSRALYLSPQYQEIFKSRGTKIHILNTAVEFDIMKTESVKLLQSLI